MYVAYENVSQGIHIDRMSMDGNKRSKKYIADGLRDVKLHYSKELKRIFWTNPETGEIEHAESDGS